MTTQHPNSVTHSFKSNVKNFAAQWTPPAVWNCVRRLKNSESKYFALNDLDKKIEKHLDKDNGFFVELGANDGQTQSNTLYFERNRNWTGVLVEPTPHNYLLCRKNRSQKSKIFCNACVSFEYKEKFVEIAFSNLMSSPLGLESDILNPLEHAKSGRAFLKSTDDNFTFGALARPLNDLLIESNAPKVIDLLSLDVEGAELEVLKGINHSHFRFSFMCIETRNVEKLAAYLKNQSYELIEPLSKHDFLFKSIN